VAAATGHPLAVANLALVQQGLSPSQIEAARNRAPQLIGTALVATH
jgi:hypothetical protein